MNTTPCSHGVTVEKAAVNMPPHKTLCQTGVLAGKENSRHHGTVEPEKHTPSGSPSADVTFKLRPEKGAGVNKVKSPEEHSRQREESA